MSIQPYCRLMRLDKPIGILLFLWPTLWGLWIAANGIPPLTILIVFILGVVVMRSAGCVINDIADRNFDGKVTRTKARPMATGEISVKKALLLLTALSIIALSLVLTLNILTLKLALFAFIFSMIYPFTKRFIQLPQVILGLAFSWSIPMAFAAITNTIPMIAWILFATSLCWTVAYDTQYAMTDREDDLKVGIKSSAILFGNYDRLVIGILQITVITLLICTGIRLQFHIEFYLGLLAATFLAIYQQFLIYRQKPSDCFKAFLNNHWFGMVIFIGVALGFGFR